MFPAGTTLQMHRRKTLALMQMQLRKTLVLLFVTQRVRKMLPIPPCSYYGNQWPGGNWITVQWSCQVTVNTSAPFGPILQLQSSCFMTQKYEISTRNSGRSLKQHGKTPLVRSLMTSLWLPYQSMGNTDSHTLNSSGSHNVAYSWSWNYQTQYSADLSCISRSPRWKPQ